MSEQPINAEMASPKSRAVAYLEMRQNGKFIGHKDEKGVKTPIVPEKIRRAGPVVETVTAYEKVIDTLGDKGYEGLKQKLENLRPAAYDAAQVVQWGAKAVDSVFTLALVFAPDWIRMFPGRLVAAGRLNPTRWPFLTAHRAAGALTTGWGRFLGTIGMMRFRPAEWATAQVAKIGGAVVSSDVVAPIVNNILGGGERVEPAKAKPAPFSGAKPQAA